MKKALITGVTGQDGAYLAQRGEQRFLLSKELVQKIQQAFGRGL